MKRWLVLFLVMMTAMLGLGAVALAESNPVTVKMELSRYEFTEPGDVDVTIKVTNTGDRDLPGAMKLFYPDGSEVTEFGEPTLAAGTAHSWSGTVPVTEQMLSDGKVTFVIEYSIWDSDGNPLNKKSHFSKQITFTGGVVSMEVNRSITPTSAGKGQKVTVTYELINTGTVEITDVVITENKAISSKAGTIASIPVGEKKSCTFTVTMGKANLKSKATITYKAGGESYKTTKEEATIKYGEVKLKATLEADKKGGAPGETVTLKLTLKNSGKTAYTDLVVTDPTLGEVFTVDSVEGGKTVTLEKTLTLADSTDLQFTVKGKDSSGDEMETATERLSLTVIHNDQIIDLHVNATAETTTVYELPAIVKFRVYVTNNSTIPVTKVNVKAGSMVLYTFPTIEAGETREFTRDVEIRMEGQYQFTAVVADQLNENQTFDSNIVRIVRGRITPVPTEVPLKVPTQPTLKPMPESIENEYKEQQALLGNAGNIALIVAGVCGVLSLLGIVCRLVVALKRRKSIDRLDDASVRDYERDNGTSDDDESAPVERRTDTDPTPEDLQKPSDALQAEDTMTNPSPAETPADATLQPAAPTTLEDDERTVQPNARR